MVDDLTHIAVARQSENPYYGSLPAPRVTSAPYKHAAGAYPPADEPPDIGAANNYQRRKRNAPMEEPPTQGFFDLNLNTPAQHREQDSFPLRQQHHRPRSGADVQDSAHHANRHEQQLLGEESTSGIRIVGQTQRTQQPIQPDDYSTQRTPNTMSRSQRRSEFNEQSWSRPGNQSSSNAFGEVAPNDAALRRKISIPRKEVPHNFQDVPSTYQSVPSSSLPTDRNRRTMLSSARPNYSEGDHRPPQGEVSRDLSQYSQPSAQQVVDRARENTRDTQVVEKIAP
ncbi:MAG: hypothetical protein Q9196_000967, partial [Gyalolechia fulgens]